MIYVDPSGNFIVAVGSSAEEAKVVLEVLQTALKEAGASELAENLVLGEIGGDYQITAEGDIALFTESDNSTAQHIGEAIESTTPVHIDVTKDDLSEFGGAVTYSANTGLEDKSAILIRINPEQVFDARIEGEFTSGPFEGMEVFLPITVGTAVVHEIGHASAFYKFHMPRYGSQTNADALMYENLHRALLARPCCTKRTKH